MFRNLLLLRRTVVLATCAGWSVFLWAATDQTDRELGLAEQLVDAFYSFESKNLEPLLFDAGESSQDILFYQGWARGGNYIVRKREPCAQLSENTISCSITVQDDLVLALGINFDVTDTFTIAFEGGAIKSVDTSSNDPQTYHDARDWTLKNRSDLVQPHCPGPDLAKADPHKCVQGMLQGYIEYARLNNLTPRQPTK